MEIRRGLRFLVLSACVGALLFSSLQVVFADELLIENPGNKDVWKYRGGSSHLGKVIKQDPRPERQGTYEVAQSFKLSSDAMITVIEFYIVVATGKPCITGVDLELHGDHKGRPSKLLVNSNARISIGPLKKGGFQSFEFDKPVVLKKGIPYWIVLNKPDKPGEEYAYSVPNSIKDVDEEGIPMPKDWYPDGKASCRLNSLTTGQGKWGYGVGPSQDYYFRIFGATVLHESK